MLIEHLNRDLQLNGKQNVKVKEEEKKHILSIIIYLVVYHLSVYVYCVYVSVHD